MSPAEIDAARKLADEARARADAATKGPWTVANVLPRDMREVATAGARFIRAPGERDSDPRTPPRDAPADYYDRGGRDASFIAHARTDVPALAHALTAALDALAAAEARAEKAEATIAEAWATLPPDRVRLLGGMGVTLAEVVTDAQEWRERERARADAAEAVVAAARDAISAMAEMAGAVRRALGVSL